MFLILDTVGARILIVVTQRPVPTSLPRGAFGVRSYARPRGLRRIGPSLALNALTRLSVSGLPAARARAATLGKARVRAP